jgi:hypothetical protein
VLAALLPLEPLVYHPASMMQIGDLWVSTDPQVWQDALERYWDFVLPKNLELERSLEDQASKLLKSEQLSDSGARARIAEARLVLAHKPEIVEHVKLGRISLSKALQRVAFRCCGQGGPSQGDA